MDKNCRFQFLHSAPCTKYRIHCDINVAKTRPESTSKCLPNRNYNNKNSLLKLLLASLLFLCLASETSASLRRNRYWWRKRHCPDLRLSLDERVQNADVILTGHVHTIYDSPNEPDKTAIVFVHRVIKGATNETLKRIQVHGFGDGSICRNRVRLRMTTIFLLHQVSQEHEFKLNSSLLSLRLTNLDRIQAAMKSLPYVPHKPIKPKPCERLVCTYGSVCRINGTGEYCDCSSNCGASDKGELCGSDNETYPSRCHLDHQMCSTQTLIQSLHKGSCHDGIACYAFNEDARDPCELKECKFGATCVRSMDGRMADCICPRTCPNYGDSRGSQPVCGNDSKDYDSLCHMKRASCEQKTEIKVKYVGRCDPCANVTCSYGTICKLNPRRQPKCRCNEGCGLEYRPICASDGKTYHNKCFMRVASCKNNQELRVVYSTRCEDGSNPCAPLKCDYGQQCYIDRFNISSCQCLHICEPIMRPICGVDGISYDNECELRRTACRQKLRTTVLHQGPCGIGPCAKHECHTGAICVMRHGRAECQCPTCSDELSPVCGSDGVTYKNKCKLDQQACALNNEIHIRYHDWCSGCEGKACDFHAICISNRAGEGKCMCPAEEDCPKSHAPVCATDGQTYVNECQMKRIACLKKTFIIKASKGTCDSCSGVSCLWGAQCLNGRCVCPTKCPTLDMNSDICASDGKLYKSECSMQRTACESGMTMTVVEQSFCAENAQYGDLPQPGCTDWPCTLGGVCMDVDSTGIWECMCLFDCTDAPFDPVCGTDSVVYSSTCGMDRDSCYSHTPIYQQAMQHCLDSLKLEKKIESSICANDRCNSTYTGSCDCNRIGSINNECDSSGECPCRPGVGGLKCDHCLAAFWGIHLIASGNMGCQPCGCSAFGSDREDCEQTTGRCVCRGKATGKKCSNCPRDYLMSNTGCVHESHYLPATNCAQMQCHHNSKCVMSNGRPFCVCQQQCHNHLGLIEVCGSDGLTYPLLCDLRKSACATQKDIVAVGLGSCPRVTSQSSKNSRETAGSSESRMEIPQIFQTTTKSPNIGELGSRCYGDWDCKVSRSICAEHVGKKVCLCKRGYIPADGNTQCELFESVESNELNSPCFESPCRNEGECIVKGDNKFMCQCSSAFTGDLCQYRALKHLYTLPQFSGNSYVELTRLDAYSHVKIEVELKMEENEGIILYNGQFKDSKGDFIALVVRDSFIEFRYNLGDGTVIVTSEEPIETNKWYTVIASRTGREGYLKIDDLSPIHTKVSDLGRSKHLNLKTNLFVGNVPNPTLSTLSNTGTGVGLHGCLRSLKVNDKVYDLRVQLSADILKSHAMGECGVNPCSSLPCLNGASCQTISDTSYECTCPSSFTGIFCETPLDACVSEPCEWGGTCRLQPNRDDQFVCLCPIGRTGQYCEQAEENGESVVETVVPSFYGDGFLELPHLPTQTKSVLTFELWLRPIKNDGILIFSADSDEFLGYSGKDFIALVLSKGYPQLIFNLGKGVTTVLSRIPLTLNEWHSIRVERNLRNATLIVDDGDPVFGQAPPGLSKLNLDSFPVYVGGVRDSRTIPPSVLVKTGFYGAIQRFSINGSPIKDLIQAAFLSSGLGKYEGPPCIPGVCRNGGICIPHLNKYLCKCPAKYSGQRCELEIQSDSNEGKPAYFDGETRMVYQNKITESQFGQRTSKFSMQFRTKASDGLIWWENKGISLNGDYLAVALTQNKLSLAYNLGKENSFLARTYNKNISDGQWHTLKINRVKRQIYMSVDGENTIAWVSQNGATELNTDGLIWIGGKAELPKEMPASFYHRFVGCIGEIYINDKLLNLHRDVFTPPQRQIKSCPDI